MQIIIERKLDLYPKVKNTRFWSHNRGLEKKIIQTTAFSATFTSMEGSNLTKDRVYA